MTRSRPSFAQTLPAPIRPVTSRESPQNPLLQSNLSLYRCLATQILATFQSSWGTLVAVRTLFVISSQGTIAKYSTSVHLTEDDQRDHWAMPDGLRAPEVFLGCPWGTPVDVWSVGCMVRSLTNGCLVTTDLFIAMGNGLLSLGTKDIRCYFPASGRHISHTCTSRTHSRTLGSYPAFSRRKKS